MPEPAFEGSLAEIGLPDVLQLLTVGGKSGALHLNQDGAEGRIYLVEGQVIHAAAADARST